MASESLAPVSEPLAYAVEVNPLLGNNLEKAVTDAALSPLVLEDAVEAVAAFPHVFPTGGEDVELTGGGGGAQAECALRGGNRAGKRNVSWRRVLQATENTGLEVTEKTLVYTNWWCWRCWLWHW